MLYIALALSHVPTSESSTAVLAPRNKPSHPLLPHPSHSVGNTPISPSPRAAVRCLPWTRPPYLSPDGHPAPSLGSPSCPHTAQVVL